jgi:hypothetical protein
LVRPRRRNTLADRFTTVEFHRLILDALELRPAAGILCCPAGIKVEILHLLHLDACCNPQLLLVLLFASDQSRERRLRGTRECWRWLGLGVASMVCSICIRVTCEDSGDGSAYGQDGLGDGSPLHTLLFSLFLFSFQPVFFG